jgi:shikimate dehydrogenase
VIPHLDRLNPAGELIGAVNCVINHDGELIGDNTDGKGFLQSLANVHGIKGLHAVVLGAGGAARAIAIELALAHAASITIVNCSIDRCQTLSRLILDRTDATSSFVPWEGKYQIPEKVDLVVNATSMGLFPNTQARLDLYIQSLRSGLIVCDVIPNPPQTRLLQDAAERGCMVLDGLGMLVNQGVICIRLWSGCEPSTEVMRKALIETILEPETL